MAVAVINARSSRDRYCITLFPVINGCIFVNYGLHFLVNHIQQTHEFDVRISSLRDKIGQKQVLIRLARLSLGHWGDCKPVGGDVTERRIHSGPGYRVYCWQEGVTAVVALGGGDKSTQDRDISRAQNMVRELKE